MTSTAGRILGNYQLGEPIGRGGASEVFAGVHRFLGHEVAVKLLRADLPGGEPAASSIEAFLGEAARARAVRHPNLVAVLDFGRDDASGRCYLVMERIPGESLAERLRRVVRLGEPETRALGAALADAMHAAHDGGIVHRDLKPANVMLRGDQPTVVDFGLARDLGGQSALETGRRVGTPAYMAPEQLTGGLIAPCVDIWSLGVILFEALTGRLPFEGFADGRAPQLFETAPRVASLVQVTPELDALVAACLERSPGRRPPTMAGIARALRGEGDERVTQDVAEPLMSALPAAGGVESSGTSAASGDVAPVARPAHPVAPLLDPSAPPAKARLAPATSATRTTLALPRRPWLLVALAAAAASLAAVLTVRAVGGADEAGRPAPAPGAPDRAAQLAAAASASTAEGPDETRPGPSEPGRAEGLTDASHSGASEPRTAEGLTDASHSGASEPRTAEGLTDAARPGAAAGVTPGPSSSLAALPAPPASLAVDVRSNPAGADVFVAGKRRGRTPLRLDLPRPGRVLLRKRGYRPAAVRVERAGLVDVHLTRSGRARTATEKARAKEPDPPRGEGLD